MGRTKEVAVSDPIEHPAWCDLSRCGVTADHPTGTHCSHLVQLGPYPPASVVAEVSLAQGPPVPGYRFTGRPFVALSLNTVDEEPFLTPLSIELAGGLGRVLLVFARESARERRRGGP
jgi:hypothetical protein